MTAQQFCDTFNCYITFTRSGDGQIFGLGSHPPKYMAQYDFFTPTNGKDATLLPFLVEDYDYFHNRRKEIILVPGGSYIIKEEEKEKQIMECNDFKKDDMFEGNVEVTEIFTMPDTKAEGEKYIITCRDENNHDLVWNTKAKNIPSQGDKKFLRAKIVKNTASVEFGVPAFEVTGCKFLMEKKKK